MRYFSFTMGAGEWKRWGSALPLPSFKKTLTSHNGQKIQVAYELKYRPTKSNEWYFIADLQRSYQSVINGVRFDDHLVIEGNGWESTGELYTLTELKVFPTDGRAYPPIIRWASNKKTFRSKAFTYAKRLKYEGLLSFASMMGALIVINSKMKATEQHKARTLERLTNDILAQSDEWVVKLSKTGLTALRSDLGQKRGKQLSAEKQDRIHQISNAINSGAFVKPSGEINKSKLAEFLGVDRRTIYNLLPFVLGVIMMLILWIRPTHDINALFTPYLIEGGSNTTI
ncbi:hypothetical protein [Sulfuricurvum sp.]|uniref:hypothetical protein n=1 Tax=Sulfuricurvum sp. TaxID=2025608 RepID=UPI00260FC7D3|nr:hypothetical protein [Sulfuricurvum sp.]MDD2265776.1 hypothetical protein [Sulfuricurvum sp.]MDD2783103.1 hypothetical protein [Sulfuricurvum sp.]